MTRNRAESDLHKEIKALKDKIIELEFNKSDCTPFEKQIKKLKHELGKIKTSVQPTMEQNERYRTALNRIAYPADSMFPNELRQTAKNALEGEDE